MEEGIFTFIFRFIHYASLPAALVLFCAVIFTADDRKRGKAMMLSLSAAVSLNVLLKAVFRVPRPWLMHPETAPLLAEGGYALPCLHTQVTAAVLCAFALFSGKKRIRFLCAAGICVTAAVRVMGGVQSAADVLTGIAAGILCAFLICRFRYSGNAAARRLTGGIVFMTGAAAAVFFSEPWGAGSALSVLALDLLERVFSGADSGRTRFGKLYGTVLAIGIYAGAYIFLPFLIEWLVTPFWPGQIMIVFLVTLLPCLLPLFPVF